MVGCGLDIWKNAGSPEVVCGIVAPIAEEPEHPVSAAADNKSVVPKMRS